MKVIRHLMNLIKHLIQGIMPLKARRFKQSENSKLGFDNQVSDKNHQASDQTIRHLMNSIRRLIRS